MNDQTPDKKAPDLLDTTLTESLQTRWPAREITERQVQTILATLEPQNRKFSMQTRLSNILRPLAFIGGLALLVLTLSWIFGSIRPNPASKATPTPTAFSTTESELPAETPDLNATATPTSTRDSASEILLTPTSLPPITELPTNGYASMPNVTFAFATTLPTSPAQITIYQQKPEGTLTEDVVREVAQQMGVNGEVISYVGEGGDTIYSVIEGEVEMSFYGFPSQFSYFVRSTIHATEPLPFDQRVAIAEEFLTTHGLLTESYRVQQSEADPYGLRFVQTLENIPLIYGIGYTPSPLHWITISIDSTGQVHSLYYSDHNYQPVGELPLLSAEQAWARLSAANAGMRAQYAVLSPSLVWIQDGSEATETLRGWLDNQNGNNTFYADDSRILALADIPIDMYPSPVLIIEGTVTDNTITWTKITLPGGSYGSSNSCGGGGGGGGGYLENADFGGGGLALVTLDPSAPAINTDYVSPIQPGDSVDGVQGVLYAVRYIHADDSENTQYSFWFAGDETHPGWTATLVGNAIAGTESLQNLPIKVWGTVTSIGADRQAVITVERYEEAYPGTVIQAWLGTEQAITLEGKDVLLFTTLDGVSYVLNSSIQLGVEMSWVGVPGDRLVLEGYSLPDNNFGGYPVMTELSMSIENNRTDLTDYIIQSNRLGIHDEADNYVDPGLTLTGHITIETVELMYSAASLETCTPEFINNPDYVQWLYAQPVWRFTGHFNDGRLFEVQIQALPDEYLR